MHQILVENKAKRFLRRLNFNDSKKIISTLEKLSMDPRGGNVKKLEGVKGYRLKIGDYRVLFNIYDAKKIVKVFKIGHRRDIYR